MNARSLRLCTGAVRPGVAKALSGPAGRLIEYQWLSVIRNYIRGCARLESRAIVVQGCQLQPNYNHWL